MKKIPYISPMTKSRRMEQQPLMAVSPDVNGQGTEVKVPGTGEGAHAGTARSKQTYTLWEDDNEE